MPYAKPHAVRRKDQDSPELLISYLRYALDDVRAVSERSGRHLEQAISTLTEDTSLINVSRTVGNMRRS